MQADAERGLPLDFNSLPAEISTLRPTVGRNRVFLLNEGAFCPLGKRGNESGPAIAAYFVFVRGPAFNALETDPSAW
jgi:hypothetical protein